MYMPLQTASKICCEIASLTTLLGTAWAVASEALTYLPLVITSSGGILAAYFYILQIQILRRKRRRRQMYRKKRGLSD
jgi:hypothetical protein